MIVEVTVFRLHAWVDESSFLASDRRVQTELAPHQPGFVRRTTARRDADWLVLIFWADVADAEASAAAVGGHPAQVAFEAHIDAASLRTDRFETLD